MNCYNHIETVAIGTCKACSKGLCMECATDLGHGLACKGVHEESVKKINNIIEKNAKIYSAAPKNTLIAPTLYLFMGLVFTYFGYTSRQGFQSLPFIMGAGFIVFSVVVFIVNKKLFGNVKDKT